MKYIIRDIIPTTAKSNTLSIPGVYGHHQLDAFSCGYTAIVTLLVAVGVTFTLRDLYAEVNPCPDNGTSNRAFTRALRAYDMPVAKKQVTVVELTRALKAGDLCAIAAHQETDDDDTEHWMVISAYDPYTKSALLLNNTGRPGFTKKWWPIKQLRKECWEKSMFRVGTALEPVDLTASETLLQRWISPLLKRALRRMSAIV